MATDSKPTPFERLKSRDIRYLGLANDIVFNNAKGTLGVAILVVITVASLGAPVFAPYDPEATLAGPALQGPTLQGMHLFGTDDIGRDILSRFLFGARISIFIGVVSGLVATIVATLIGVPAGYYQGRLGDILTSGIDIALVFPPFILIVVFASYLGNSLINIILVLSLLSWPIPARTIKAKAISVSKNDFVESTRALGASDFTLMKDEVLPNVSSIVLANGILQIVYVIIIEAALAFIGLGDPTTVSWGSMLFYAKDAAALSLGAWWWFLFPGIGIILTAFGFTLLGTAIDEELNPRLQRRTWG